MIPEEIMNLLNSGDANNFKLGVSLSVDTEWWSEVLKLGTDYDYDNCPIQTDNNINYGINSGYWALRTLEYYIRNGKILGYSYNKEYSLKELYEETRINT